MFHLVGKDCHEIGEGGVGIGARIVEVIPGEQMAVTPLEPAVLIQLVGGSEIDFLAGEVTRTNRAPAPFPPAS
jgi:hypothetical protein